MARTIRLAPGAEFDLIRRLAGTEEGMGSLPAEVMVGSGDDAAVLRDGWVISTDLSVEDVHFRRAWIDDTEVGYRAAIAGISDLAAMGASPVALLLSLAAPRGGAVDVEAVGRGVREAAARYGAAVIGGDLSRSPGPLVLDIVALGCTSWPVHRDGAEPGDHVWVTGHLGAAVAAAVHWQAGEGPATDLRAAFAAPAARVDEARCLVEREVVDAMIDVSDGLAGDVGHIAAASGVAVTLEADRIPVAPAVAAAHEPEEALRLALHGGEDYELCFVTDPDVVDAADFEARFGIPVTRVGTVSEGEGVWLQRTDGSRERLEGGFDHWREAGDA